MPKIPGMGHGSYNRTAAGGNANSAARKTGRTNPSGNAKQRRDGRNVGTGSTGRQGRGGHMTR